MDLEGANSARFFDRRRHVDALGELAARALERGRGAAAFAFADRRRRLIRAGARDILLCAEAARLAGWTEYARDELRLAMDRDPDDALVNGAALRWGDDAQQAEARRRLGPETRASLPAPQPAHRIDGPPEYDADAVQVVVPVYDDYPATQACLASLLASGGEARMRVCAVDDATPDPRIRALLGDLAERGAIDLLVNPVNIGFAASVNRALARRTRGDVLLFNADALAPPRLVERLRRAVRTAPGAGVATPLSNNGELTNYPSPRGANPELSNASAMAIDARAKRANGDAVIDLPSGVGFCLYITRACLDAVGGLSERYRRGYLEDVDFCLRARELGFRNVCATGVFVAHLGARSFGAEKRGWVARNLQIFEPRFPYHRGEVAAFFEADPLSRFRSAIDERCELGESVVLRLGAASLAEDSPVVLQAQVAAGNGRLSLQRLGPGAPQSLSFTLDEAGLAALDAYVRRLHPVRVEIADPAEFPETLLRRLRGWGAPIEWLCEDLGVFQGRRESPGAPCRNRGGPGPCAPCATSPAREAAPRARLALALSIAEAVRATDRLGAAFARRVLRELPLRGAVTEPVQAPRRPEPDGAVLGVLAPRPRAEIDRLALRLGRELAAAGDRARLVVIGACLDDLAVMASGRVHVTGRADASEHAGLVDRLGVTRLALLDRRAAFGPLDRLAARVGAPKAYFDGAYGELVPDPADLALDPRVCDDMAATRLREWLRRDFPAEGSP